MSTRIISVSYGHGDPSGKLYDYSTDKEYRTGDVIVVPVEHHGSHKLYNTLAIVRKTTDEDSYDKEQKADGLTKSDAERDDGRNISSKDVGMRLKIAQKQGLDVDSSRQVGIRTLPGYKPNSDSWGSSKTSMEEVERRTGRIITRTPTAEVNHDDR